MLSLCTAWLTSSFFWRIYGQLECLPPVETCPNPLGLLRWTARKRWRYEHVSKAAASIARRLRANVHLMPLDSTMMAGKDGMYHVSLVGHFSQDQLQLALQHPGLEILQRTFASKVICHLCDVLDDLEPAPNNNVIMLTLQLFHSRQAGFSDLF